MTEFCPWTAIQENLIRVVLSGRSVEWVAGEPVELETYLDARADLNAPDADGATPLMKMMELSNTTLHTETGRRMLLSHRGPDAGAVFSEPSVGWHSSPGDREPERSGPSVRLIAVLVCSF